MEIEEILDGGQIGELIMELEKTCKDVGREKRGGGGGRPLKGDSVLPSHTLRFLGESFW